MNNGYPPPPPGQGPPGGYPSPQGPSPGGYGTPAGYGSYGQPPPLGGAPAQSAAAQPGYGPPQGAYGPPQGGYGPPQGAYAPSPPQAAYAPPPAPNGSWAATGPAMGVQLAGAPPVLAPPVPAATSAYGDAASEHLTMKRGRFSAWPYVVLAFMMEIALLGFIPGFAAAFAIALATSDGGVVGLVGLLFGAFAGVIGAFFMFRDRWRCNEAFSSRFCSGLMNLSLLYVPWIALVYANVRGVQKLFGK